MTKVGLITILYNSNEVLEGFIKSINKQTFKNYHLYIIDNTPSASTDECLAELLEKFPLPSYSHMKSDSNIGFAKGNNIAIKKALQDGCDYLLILNNDIEIEQYNMLQLMVEAAETKNEPLIIPKILFFDSREVWTAGGNQRFWAMAAHVGEGRKDSYVYNNEAYFDFAPLCVMLIKASVFEIVGLLDENYFVYFEDTDFLFRAKQHNFKVFYMPQLTVLHKVSSSTGGADSLFSIFYGNRNWIYFIRKHYGFWRKIIVYFLVFGSRAIKYIKYDKKQRLEMVRAIKAGFKMLLK